jgi:hypothetical protein
MRFRPSGGGADAPGDPQDGPGGTLASELAEVRSQVRAEKLSALAVEFDAIHSIRRAVEVGSVDAVIAASELRPAITKHVDTWMRERARRH